MKDINPRGTISLALTMDPAHWCVSTCPECPPPLASPSPVLIQDVSVGGGVRLGRPRVWAPTIPPPWAVPPSPQLAMFTRPGLIDSLSLSFYLLHFVIKCAGEARKLLFFPILRNYTLVLDPANRIFLNYFIKDHLLTFFFLSLSIH